MRAKDKNRGQALGGEAVAIHTTVPFSSNATKGMISMGEKGCLFSKHGVFCFPEIHNLLN